MVEKIIRRVRKLTTFFSDMGLTELSSSADGLKTKYLSANPRLIQISNMSITTSHAINVFTQIHHDY
jgi:hypothetical protein